MTIHVDAIRASLRIVQSGSGPSCRPDALTGPVTLQHHGDLARAGPRAIESGGDAGNATDQALRERKLWAQDMRVRAERAAGAPDGELRSLPSYEYKVGPDGRVYATGDVELPTVGTDVPVPPQIVQRAYALPTEQTAANEVDTVT